MVLIRSLEQLLHWMIQNQGTLRFVDKELPGGKIVTEVRVSARHGEDYHAAMALPLEPAVNQAHVQFQIERAVNIIDNMIQQRRS